MNISALESGSSYLKSGLSTNGTDADKLESKIKNLDNNDSSDEELMEVCKDFEAYFVEQMLKSLKKTVNVFSEEEESDNSYVNYFSDISEQEYASNIVDSGEFGIAQSLYESMKRKYII